MYCLLLVNLKEIIKLAYKDYVVVTNARPGIKYNLYYLWHYKIGRK